MQFAGGEHGETGVVGNRAITVSLSEKVGCEGTWARGGTSQRKTPRAGGHRTLPEAGGCLSSPGAPRRPA